MHQNKINRDRSSTNELNYSVNFSAHCRWSFWGEIFMRSGFQRSCVHFLWVSIGPWHNTSLILALRVSRKVEKAYLMQSMRYLQTDDCCLTERCSLSENLGTNRLLHIDGNGHGGDDSKRFVGIQLVNWSNAHHTLPKNVNRTSSTGTVGRMVHLFVADHDWCLVQRWQFRQHKSYGVWFAIILTTDLWFLWRRKVQTGSPAQLSPRRTAK